MNVERVGSIVILALAIGCSDDSSPQPAQTTYVSFVVEQATTGEHWHLKTRGCEVDSRPDGNRRTITGLPEECAIFPTGNGPESGAEVSIVAGDRDWILPIAQDKRVGLRDMPLSLMEFEFLESGTRPSLS